MTHRLTLKQPFADPALEMDCEFARVELSQISRDVLTPNGEDLFGVYAVHRGRCLKYGGMLMDRVFLSFKRGASLRALGEDALNVSVHRIIKDSQFKDDERGPDRATLSLLCQGKLERLGEG